MNWWIPLAFVGAAVVGAAIAFALARAGGPAGRGDVAQQAGLVEPGPRRTRYEEDNRLAWNPGAFLAVAGVVGFLLLLALLIELT